MSKVSIQIKTEDGLIISKRINLAVLQRYSSPPSENWDGAFVIGEFDESRGDDIGENFVSIYLDKKDLDKLQKKEVDE